MSLRMLSVVVCTVMVMSAWSSTADAQQYADVLGYYEPGQHVGLVDVFGYGSVIYDNPSAALGGPTDTVMVSDGIGGQQPTTFVSLGTWYDDANTGSGHTPAIVLGFSAGVTNGAGHDLRIAGNTQRYPGYPVLFEPGFVEVAKAPVGGGPVDFDTLTWYLLKPSNYDQLAQNPRVGPTDISYTYDPSVYGHVFDPSSAFPDENLTGYVDVTPTAEGGDLFDLDWAIDAAGNHVALSSIDYIRIRSVTASSIDYSIWDAVNLDYFSAEVDYVENLHAVPEPMSMALLTLGGATMLKRRR